MIKQILKQVQYKMNSALSYKTKQFFFVLIKLSIVVGAFYFIYNKLTQNNNLNFNAFVSFLVKNESFSLKNISFLLILSIFNWFFEIVKWHILVSYVKNISFKKALEQSLGAFTASLFTPNRIGEYGAKAIYFSPTLRKQIMLLNLIGNMMQMCITVILGVIGFWFLLSNYDIEINYYKVTRLAVIVLFVAILIGFGITQNKFKIKGFSIEKIKRFINNMPLQIKVLGFFFSFVRYLIFSFQFYFLLQILGVEISYLNAMMVITSMHLLASVLPSIFVFDVIIKGSIAVYLFSFLDINSMMILSIITLMWLLNFVLPSLFGSFYVLNFNFPKDND